MINVKGGDLAIGQPETSHNIRSDRLIYESLSGGEQWE
jgi:hypothetical protein